MNLTYPEIVTEYNINKLYKYVRNGPFKHPGAKSIKRAIDGRTTSLQHTDLESITLSMGDVVHRHLADGDTVLFNRQPSLHKMSMMGHKIKVRTTLHSALMYQLPSLIMLILMVMR